MLVKRMTTPWSAPEVLLGETASPRSDVYSFGIICWELMTRKVPYEGKSMDWIQHSICKRRERLKIPRSRSDRALHDVISDSEEEDEDDDGVETLPEDESFFDSRPTKSSKSSKKNRSTQRTRTTRDSNSMNSTGDISDPSSKNNSKNSKNNDSKKK